MPLLLSGQNDISDPKLKPMIEGAKTNIDYQQNIEATTKLKTPKLHVAHCCKNNQHGERQKFILLERHEL